MKIAIFEIGDYHDTPDTTRVFLSMEKAVENIPPEFVKEYFPGCYVDENYRRWLNITEHEVEE